MCGQSSFSGNLEGGGRILKANGKKNDGAREEGKAKGAERGEEKETDKSHGSPPEVVA